MMEDTISENELNFDELEANKEQDFDPEEIAQNQAEEVLAQKEAEVTAVTAVSVLEAGVSLIQPGIQIQPEQKQQVADKLAAVLLKYEVSGLPGWMIAYKEELELALSFGMVGLSIAAQVRAAKAQAEAQAEAQTEAQTEAQAETNEAEYGN